MQKGPKWKLNIGEGEKDASVAFFLQLCIFVPI